MSAAAIPEKSVLEEIVNVAIVYNDAASAARANAILQRALRSADGVPMLNIKPWRLDLLHLPPLADEALKETSNAHLVVLALHSNKPGPNQLLEWLENWATYRQIGEAALATLTSGDSPVSMPLLPTLLDLTKRHGLNFIFGAGDLTPTRPGVVNDSPGGETVTAPPLQENMEDPLPHHWGINE